MKGAFAIEPSWLSKSVIAILATIPLLSKVTELSCLTNSLTNAGPKTSLAIGVRIWTWKSWYFSQYYYEQI